MMMMTLMKLVNSGTKIRPGIDKFYQPHSGLRSSKRADKAIYTHVYAYVCICILNGHACNNVATLDVVPRT